MGGKLRLECKIKKRIFENHLELDCSSQARKDMHTEDKYCTLRVGTGESFIKTNMKEVNQQRSTRQVTYNRVLTRYASKRDGRYIKIRET